jgi:ubiquinone/menaquinone biosynthesis C-methylase UbiE
MDAEKISAVRTAYDRVADEYVAHINGELEHKPLDRQLLDRFAAHVKDKGLVCDLGTGPGHVARYLHGRGARVCGIDLSPAMIQHARELSPDIEFREGNMFALELPDGFFAAMTAFYAIVNIPPSRVGAAFREMHRVLQLGGLLMLAFHLGDETLHRDEMWGVPVSLDFHFFKAEEILALLRAAQFEIREVIERDPYPDVEYASRRAYIFARKI